MLILICVDTMLRILKTQIWKSLKGPPERRAAVCGLLVPFDRVIFYRTKTIKHFLDFSFPLHQLILVIFWSVQYVIYVCPALITLSISNVCCM